MNRNIFTCGIAAVALICSFAAVAEDESLNLPNETRGSEKSMVDSVKQKKYEQDSKITDMQINAEAGSLVALQFAIHRRLHRRGRHRSRCDDGAESPESPH